MARIKIDFIRKPIPQQIEKARDITGKMAGNLSFPAPVPTLPSVIQLTDDLETAYIAALNGGKDKKALMRAKQRELQSAVSTLAAYVQTTSSGNETIILSSGFGVCQQRQPVSIPVTPQNVKVLPAVKEGELEIVWTRVPTAKSYVVQFVKDPLTEQGFAPVDFVTRASVVIMGLEPGVKYWFRVMAINSKGKSAWSVPCSGRVLLF